MKIDLDEMATRAPNEGEQKFDPEGPGYDYESARTAGLAPDASGRWPSRDPSSGMILQGARHPAAKSTMDTEVSMGNVIAKHADGRYYSNSPVEMANQWLQPDEYPFFEPKPIDQQVKEQFGVAAQYGWSREQAESVIREKNIAQAKAQAKQVAETEWAKRQKAMETIDKDWEKFQQDALQWSPEKFQFEQQWQDSEHAKAFPDEMSRLAFQIRATRDWPGTDADKEALRKSFYHRYIRERTEKGLNLIQQGYDAAAAAEEAEYLKDHVGGKTAKRWERGTATLAAGAAHLLDELSRWENSATSEEAKDWARMYHEVLNEPSMQPVVENWFDHYIGGAVESGPFMAAAMVPSMLTGGATFPSLVSGFLTTYAVEGNEAYQSALDRGEEEDRARAIGMVVGIVNGAIEMGGGTGGKYYKDQVVQKATSVLGKAKGFSRKVVENALKEGFVEEMPQELVQMLAGDNQGDPFTRLIDAAIMGTIAGGGTDIAVDVMTHGVNALDAKIRASQAMPVSTDLDADGYSVLSFDNKDEADRAFQALVDEAKASGVNVDIRRDGNTLRFKVDNTGSQAAGPTTEQAKAIEAENAEYDRLMALAEEGDPDAVSKLNDLVQKQSLPTYDELLERAQNGDQQAAADIQLGRYRWEGGNAQAAGQTATPSPVAPTPQASAAPQSPAAAPTTQPATGTQTAGQVTAQDLAAPAQAQSNPAWRTEPSGVTVDTKTGQPIPRDAVQFWQETGKEPWKVSEKEYSKWLADKGFHYSGDFAGQAHFDLVVSHLEDASYEALASWKHTEDVNQEFQKRSAERTYTKDAYEKWYRDTQDKTGPVRTNDLNLDEYLMERSGPYADASKAYSDAVESGDTEAQAQAKAVMDESKARLKAGLENATATTETIGQRGRTESAQGEGAAPSAPAQPAATIEVVMLFDELRANRLEWSKASTKRKAELMARNKELARELVARGYDKQYVKAVESGKKEVPFSEQKQTKTEQVASAPKTETTEGPITKQELATLKEMGYTTPQVLAMNKDEVKAAREKIAVYRKKGKRMGGAARFGTNPNANKVSVDDAIKLARQWVRNQVDTTKTEPPTAPGKWDANQYEKDFEQKFGRQPNQENMARAQAMHEEKQRQHGLVTLAKREGYISDSVESKYTQRNTDALMLKAANYVATDFDGAVKMANEGTDQYAIAVMIELMKEYRRRAANATTDAERASYTGKITELVLRKAQVLTEHGQAGQIAVGLTLQTPEGLLDFVSRTIAQYNKTHRKQIANLTQDQADALLKNLLEIEKMPETNKKEILAKKKRFGKVIDQIQSLVPSSWWKQLMGITRAGLLTAMRTTGVNLAANTTFGFTEIGADTVAIGYDLLMSLMTGKRTRAATAWRSWMGVKHGSKEAVTYMLTNVTEREELANRLDYSKTVLSPELGIVGRGLQIYMDLVNRLMQAEDHPFYYSALYRSLGSQCAAYALNHDAYTVDVNGKKEVQYAKRGTSVDAVKKMLGKGYENATVTLRGNLTGAEQKALAQATLEAVPEDIALRAKDDADDAVFQSDTALSKMAIFATNVMPILDPLVMFKRTPGAIAMQIVNYSPAGPIKELYNMARSKEGFDQYKFSKAMGRVTVGAGALWLGAQLLRMGLLTLARPTDEREQKLWELEGRQAHSIKFGNSWRTTASFGPLAVLLEVGGMFAKKMDETGAVVESITSAIRGGGRAFLEQTYMKGMNETLNVWGDDKRSLGNWTSGLAGMVVPSFLAEIARVSDSVERRTQGYGWEKIKYRVPGLRQTLEPKISVLGQDMPRYGGNIYYTLLDPDRPSKIKHDVVVDEIRRLFDGGYTIAAPTMLGSRNGYKGLTPEENTELFRLAGDHAYFELFETFRSDEYELADDAGKAKLLEHAAVNGKNKARLELAFHMLSRLPENERPKKQLELMTSGMLTKDLAEQLEDLL